ncbi:hypothetical protein GCM10023144_01670 [Pigmentiphaga soli]|uniref:Transposase n=1 Tax=Pigmentiphaga soli TaxID=1007095 RepID=A0ABP8GCY2_9BURK
MANDLNQEREAFEAWVSSSSSLPTTRDKYGFYTDWTLYDWWKVWCARAALAAPAAPQAGDDARPRPVVIGRVTVKGKGRASVDLDTSHVDLPEGDYELVARRALTTQGESQP